MKSDRRSFIKDSSKGILGFSALSTLPFFNASGFARTDGELFFKISLAEWSLNKNLFGNKITNMDFPGIAKNRFGIHAIEYVNQFFKDKAEDEAYLKELKTRTADLGVDNVLIMVDGEGHLADQDDQNRTQCVENHYKWVEAAKFLGCHSIRVNAYATSKDPEEGKAAAVDGLSRLTEFAVPYGINVIVENHGGFSSNGKWLADVMKQVGKPTCGTLPDFGNFCLKREKGKCVEEYDRYDGVKELMPYAKGVSAKTGAFDSAGNAVDTDYMKMMKIVKNFGYKGYVGIESGGATPEAEYESIKLTKALLEKVGAKLS